MIIEIKIIRLFVSILALNTSKMFNQRFISQKSDYEVLPTFLSLHSLWGANKLDLNKY